MIAGLEEEALALAGEFAAEGRKTQRLPVSHAFHSPLMEPMLAGFRRVAEELEYAEPRVPVVSNVTGALAEPGQLTDPEYWVRHVRETVRFADGVRALGRAGANAFLEIGPGGVLTALTQRVLDADGRDDAVSFRLRKDLAGRGDRAAHGPRRTPRQRRPRGLDRLVRLHRRPPRRTAHLRLPARAVLAAPGRPQRRRQHGRPDLRRDPLLGAAVPLADSEGALFTSQISMQVHPWLLDHRVGGTVIMPGTGYLEMAIRAADQVGCARVEELSSPRPHGPGREEPDRRPGHRRGS
ncbi:SDR family NAD(P)-dependent oxidoreductase OS=Streptomyces rutgersensis OX=53451 GN=F0345_01405 PE=4 SV=1 [Streptomyces diastaticus subsp. diastaticus]